MPRSDLLAAIRDTVGSVLIVDDGIPEPVRYPAGGHSEIADVSIVGLPANAGKGHAVALGVRTALARHPAPKAVVIIDADGQHPPEAIPRFLAAGEHAELVVGHRLSDLATMPRVRRLSNRLSSRILQAVTGRRVHDSQCGMRLLRGRALHEIPFTGGGYEAETNHLKRCLRAGVSVGWVPIPAIYNGSPSSFRPVRDTLRVLNALLR